MCERVQGRDGNLSEKDSGNYHRHRPFNRDHDAGQMDERLRVFKRNLTGTRYDEEDNDQKIRYLRDRDEPIDEEKVVQRVHPVRGSSVHETSTETV